MQSTETVASLEFSKLERIDSLTGDQLDWVISVGHGAIIWPVDECSVSFKGKFLEGG